MQYTIQPTTKSLTGEITLPTSKSISNRVLIINALAYSPFTVQNLSNSDDTRVMEQVLNSNTDKFDIGHAGTAMRFLTAFLSKIVGKWEITGSQRMQRRPIKILVDALNKLGAKIEYINNEGYPPLRIWGSNLKGGKLELDGSISSQYISALLMIAPTIEDGLELTLTNHITSASYIDLTLRLMAQFGIEYKWNDNVITIKKQNYKPIPYTVEADWSGASYWYQMAVLANDTDILLKGLQLDSLQGDCAQAKWFEDFGIVSTQEEHGVRLQKKEIRLPEIYNQNFVENPDIAQTFAVMCVCKGIPFHFSGLETLKIKETDRIHALITELGKMGAELTEPAHGELAWNGNLDEVMFEDTPEIDTYHDHRMALAFAPAALSCNTIKINDPGVVTKSYPGFWDDLKNVGCITSLDSNSTVC
ncbi:MAG: 3-phosphoshikimate 1-carboxyvinyltransferase [Prolixibacteraceae bacterium]|nr:3-phosphoshikimate 1-carboxyvinyltransferase [Prolixibacteraceae bacterium]MBN2649697.1 3-phosphoshikimate 1-carboxyvinyltransferase [Prolixibacteraceae bacterium]